MPSGTLAGRFSKQYPDLDSNQDLNLRRVRCDPLHHRDANSNRADDWIRTSMDRFTKPAPFFVEPRRHQHEREESNLVERLWRPLALPGARSCDVGNGPRLRPRRRCYSAASVTFQYASLTNLSQLAMRMLGAAYSGFQAGRTGDLRRRNPACAGVRSALRLLQATQANTQFVQLEMPP